MLKKIFNEASALRLEWQVKRKRNFIRIWSSNLIILCEDVQLLSQLQKIWKSYKAVILLIASLFKKKFLFAGMWDRQYRRPFSV
jgi:hypothetical protein